MILHGNQRGGYSDLATHLMKPENERVTVHELRGFIADYLAGAFRESYAISKGTRCKQHLFSLSLNPPTHADVSPDDFEKAANLAEKRLGLEGQPRALVFHDKRGEDGKLRRHAHAVWCRIDTETMKAVQLSYTHKTLREVSRELFFAHHWRMPDGLIDSRNSNVRNITLAEWQQAKRAGKDPRETKALFQDCWAVSDGRSAYAAALSEKGYILAQGKRGHVAVDHTGEVYPVSRWVGLKAKEVRERLGGHDTLPDVESAQSKAAQIIAERLKQLKDQEAQTASLKERDAATAERRLKARLAGEAAELKSAQLERQRLERELQEARLRRGVLGLLDRITGRRKRVLEQNAGEAALLALRDKRELEAVKHRFMQDQHTLTKTSRTEQDRHSQAIQELRTDIKWLRSLPDEKSDLDKRSSARKRSLRRTRSRDGPAPER